MENRGNPKQQSDDVKKKRVKDSSDEKQTNESSKFGTRRHMDAARLVMLGNVLIYAGDSIILFARDDRLGLIAAYMKLIAGGLFIIAAELQANETVTGKSLSSDIVTPIGLQKIAGALISLVGALILTNVLQKVVAATPESEATNAEEDETIIAPPVSGGAALMF